MRLPVEAGEILNSFIFIILKHVSERQLSVLFKIKKSRTEVDITFKYKHRGKERKSSPLKIFEYYDPNPTVFMTSSKCLQYIQIHKIGTSPDRENTMTQGDVPLKKEKEDLVSSH